MSPVAIGSRNVHGTFEGVTTTTDIWGQEVETFGPVDPAEWVEIRPYTGREFMEAQQVFAGLSARLRCRWRDDLTAASRFVADDGTVWVFLGPPIDPDGRRRDLEVMVGQSG